MDLLQEYLGVPLPATLRPIWQYYSTIQPFLTAVLSNITSSLLDPSSSSQTSRSPFSSMGNYAGGSAQRASFHPSPPPPPQKQQQAFLNPNPQQPPPTQKHRQQFLLDYQAILILLLTLYFSIRILNLLRRVLIYWTLLLAKTLFWGAVVWVFVLWMTSSSRDQDRARRSGATAAAEEEGGGRAVRDAATAAMDGLALIASWIQAALSSSSSQQSAQTGQGQGRRWWDSHERGRAF